jgi:hypothetical protein
MFLYGGSEELRQMALRDGRALTKRRSCLLTLFLESLDSHARKLRQLEDQEISGRLRRKSRELQIFFPLHPQVMSQRAYMRSTLPA